MTKEEYFKLKDKTSSIEEVYRLNNKYASENHRFQKGDRITDGTYSIYITSQHFTSRVDTVPILFYTGVEKVSVNGFNEKIYCIIDSNKVRLCDEVKQVIQDKPNKPKKLKRLKKLKRRSKNNESTQSV